MEYSIGAFSELVGLTIDTLRYYEKEALILPKRNSQNRRVYTEEDLNWMAFILRLKKTGMPIKDIKSYAKLRYQGEETIEQRLDLLYDQQLVLAKQREEIDTHTDFLNKKIATYKKILAQREEID